jgi:hypothetical protein
MKPLTLLAALFLVLGSLGGCGHDSEAHSHGSAQCDELGELCHDAGAIDPDAEACHEVGHVGDADACAARYDECITLCMAVLAQAGGGAGGGG